MRSFGAILFILALFGACGPNYDGGAPAPITGAEYKFLENPPPELLALFEKNKAQYRREALAIEFTALSRGRPLTTREKRMAREAGVRHPENVRVHSTYNFPIDEKSVVGRNNIALGLTVRYGIFLKPFVFRSQGVYDEVLAHELVHVAQFERWGLDEMQKRFFLEKVLLNGRPSLIEREAIIKGKQIYDSPDIEYGF